MGTHEDERTVLYVTICVTNTNQYDVTSEKYHRITKYPKTIKLNFSAFRNVMYQNLLRSRIYITVSD